MFLAGSIAPQIEISRVNYQENKCRPDYPRLAFVDALSSFFKSLCGRDARLLACARVDKGPSRGQNEKCLASGWLPSRPALLTRARVAELADALASGASDRKVVEVRVLSRAPNSASRSLAAQARSNRFKLGKALAPCDLPVLAWITAVARSTQPTSLSSAANGSLLATLSRAMVGYRGSSLNRDRSRPKLSPSLSSRSASEGSDSRHAKP